MAGVTDLQSALAQEKADLALLASQNTALLQAFASGAMTPAQAQALLDGINADDATIKTQTAAIQNALKPPAGP